MKNLITLVLTLNLALPVQSQTECTAFHRKACTVEEGRPMRYDSQSKSAVLGKGQISDFHMVAYQGLDYRIVVCTDESLGDQVQFKIYEKQRQLIQPDETVQRNVYEEDQISNEEEDQYADETYHEYGNVSEEDAYSDAYADDYSGDIHSSTPPAGGNDKRATQEKHYRMVKELLYDNAENDYVKKLEFTAESSMSLIIEVIAPGEENKSKLKIREMGCVGVLIEHEKSRKAGF